VAALYNDGFAAAGLYRRVRLFGLCLYSLPRLDLRELRPGPNLRGHGGRPVGGGLSAPLAQAPSSRIRRFGPAARGAGYGYASSVVVPPPQERAVGFLTTHAPLISVLK